MTTFLKSGACSVGPPALRSKWSVVVAFNWADWFWGRLFFPDLGIYIIGFGGPRIAITKPMWLPSEKKAPAAIWGGS